MVDPRDLRALVRMAVEAEDAGVDAVMVSEHIVLGPSAGENGIMGNPRDYALPGNQDPATPWPHSLTLLAGIATATTTLRLAAAAVIAPLRHPLLLARELGTLDLLSEGRLVVQPTVSWHRDEYEALGVPFNRRGALLDEQLAAWELLWRDTPASFTGRSTASRTCTSSRRPTGPTDRGCGSAASTCTRRCCGGWSQHGHGFHPLGRPTPEELATALGRDVGGGPRHRRARDDRRHPRRLSRRSQRRRHRPRDGVDPRPGRGGVHGDLLQALAVHRRSSRGRQPVPPRGRAGRRATS